MYNLGIVKKTKTEINITEINIFEKNNLAVKQYI